MPECSRCKAEVVESDQLKCGGSCGKVYHPACVGITKSFLKSFLENDYFVFLCSMCRSSSITAVNEKLSKILSMISIYDERVVRQGEEFKLMKQQLDENRENNNESFQELKDIIGTVKKAVENNEKEICKVNNRNNPISKPSYVDMVKGRKNDPAILIVPKDKNQNSETTKQIIKEKINPVTNPINNVRKITNGGVALECDDLSNKEAVRQEVINRMGNDYTVQFSELKKPKVKILRMYDEYDDTILIEKLKEQNDFLVNSNLKVVHKYKAMRGAHNVILEVDCTSFIKIIEAGKLRIHFEICKVVEDINVYRCFNCCGFNHKAKECSSVNICKYCAECHDSRTCNSEWEICINCKKAVQNFNVKLDIYHTAFDTNCEILKRKMEIARRRIEYNE